MSDIGITIPFPIFVALVAAAYWPVPLLLAFLAIVGTVLLRGIGRYVCMVLAVLFLAVVSLRLFLPS